MASGDAWRNKRKIQVITLIEIVLAAILLILHFYYACTFWSETNPLPAKELSVHLGRFLVFLVLVIVFLVNGWQIYVAGTLQKAVYGEEDDLDATLCIQRARRWFKTCWTLQLILVVKFFVLCLVDIGSSNNFDFFLCLFEFIFRIGGLFFVKEFLDDLTAEEPSTTLQRTIVVPTGTPLSKPITDMIEVPVSVADHVPKTVKLMITVNATSEPTLPTTETEADKADKNAAGNTHQKPPSV